MDILPFIYKLPKDKIIWYAWSGHLDNQNIKESILNKGVSQLEDCVIPGDRTYEYLFNEILTLNINNPPNLDDNSKIWKIKIEDIVDSLGKDFKKRMGLGYVFKTCWDGITAKALFEENLKYKNITWEQKCKVFLGIAGSAEQIPNKLAQRAALKKVKRILNISNTEISYRFYYCLYLLQMIEYYNTRDTISDIQRAYKIITILNNKYELLKKEISDRKRIRNVFKSLLFYKAEIGLKYGTLNDSCNILLLAEEAAKEYTIKYKNDFESMTNGLIIYSKILFSLGKINKAKKMLRKSLKLSNEIYKTHSMNHAYKMLGRIYLKEDNQMSSYDNFEKALKVSQEIKRDKALLMRDNISFYLYHKKFSSSKENKKYYNAGFRYWSSLYSGTSHEKEDKYMEYLSRLEKIYLKP